MQKRATIIGAVAISLAAILWGFDGVVLTPRLYELKIGYVVFVLHMLPFLIMNFFFHRQYRNLIYFSKSDYFYLLLVAVFGGALGTLSIVQALFLVGFQKLSVVVLLQKLQPVFGIVLAAVILKERLGPRYLLWASLAIIGGYFLTFGLQVPRVGTGGDTAAAAAFALLAAFSFGSSTVFSKKVLIKYNFATTTFYRYGFTAILMLVYVLVAGEISLVQATTPKQWGIFFIIAITTGSGAIFLYYYGLKKVKAIVSTICELFFPLSAILFDYWINDYQLSWVQWMSVIVMLVAIIQLNRDQARAKIK
ncbi:MAG: EamA family transporter [Bacteroidales bacterium]|nr:EamA family transporter [Bacteroidales bacterium]MCF8339165.1 EamA family transporter [Bacteroidales bacterium]